MIQKIILKKANNININGKALASLQDVMKGMFEAAIIVSASSCYCVFAAVQYIVSVSGVAQCVCVCVCTPVCPIFVCV